MQAGGGQAPGGVLASYQYHLSVAAWNGVCLEVLWIVSHNGLCTELTSVGST